MHEPEREDQDHVGAAGVPPSILKGILDSVASRIGGGVLKLVLFVLGFIAASAIISNAVQHFAK
jgi:hypothetical protein